MKQELGYTCPQTKKQCDDECCVSAEDCHAKAINNIISNCEPEQLNQNNMEKEFVPYELSVKLKELGFDEPTLYAYFKIGGFNKYSRVYEPIVYTLNTNGNPFGEYFSGRNWNISTKPKSKIQCSAPIFSQAFRWFREKHNMQSAIKFTHSKYSFDIHFERLANGENPPVMVWHLVDSWLGLNLDLFETYEETELACLTMLIKIVESKSE